MNAWIDRLKNQKAPGTHPTKPTKPAADTHSGGFVGFVAYPPGAFQKIDGAVAHPEKVSPTSAPQGFDPGHAALLALAMAYCDRTGATDKARQDWQQDIADTPPELRGDLYQHLRGQLPPAPPRPAPAPPVPPAARPMPWTHLDQPWRIADRAYQTHAGTCPACKTAARGHTARCEIGQRLHDQLAQAVRAEKGAA